MLFEFGVIDNVRNMSVSMDFLHSIATKFVKALSKTADIELTRENAILMPTDEDVLDILHSVPFVVGLEFINVNWIKNMYQSLSEVSANEINKYAGTVAEFLLSITQI